MAAPTQHGQTVLIGLGNYEYEGYVVETAELEKDADVDDIKGEQGETVTQLVSDPKQKLSLSCLILSDTGEPDIVKGDSLTVSGTTYMVDAVKISRSAKAAKISLTLIAEDSMTYPAET